MGGKNEPPALLLAHNFVTDRALMIKPGDFVQPLYNNCNMFCPVAMRYNTTTSEI